MHSIDNLFKLNELKINKKNTNFETMSIDELKQNYQTFKALSNNQRLINSLADKGEKIIKQFKHIEEVLQSRSNTAESNENDLENVIDQLKVVNIETDKQVKKEETKVEKTNQKVEKKENVNYFAKPVKQSQPLVNKQNLNLDAVKEKVKQKLNEQNKSSRVAKTIPFEECCKLLEEREKRVQEYQLEMTAKKLLEGQSVSYDYSFANKTETLRFQERKHKTSNDDLLSDDESDQEDYNNEYDDYDFRLEDEDDEDKSSKIDRVYKNNLDRNKFRPNLDDLERID